MHISGDASTWQGRPYGGLIFRAVDWFIVPFSFVWASGAVFVLHGVLWNSGGSSRAAPPFAIAISLLFTALGVYVTVGRFVLDIIRRRSLRYALTPAEAVITGRWPSPSERRVDFRHVAEIRVERCRDGSGTIAFGMPPSGAQFGADAMGFGPQVPSFERIANVDTVYRMILDVRRPEL